MLIAREVIVDLFTLTRFLIPVAFTDIAVDVGEQFLNRSIAQSSNVVNTLASFGLAYVLVKFCVGVLGETKHVGLVLVKDRPGWIRTWLYCTIMALITCLLLILIAVTPLGQLLFERLHHVTSSVGHMSQVALLFMCAYPLFDMTAWLHVGILLQWHYSSVAGITFLADILMQMLSVGILLHTPLLCNNVIAIPILALYAGVLVRCSISLVMFFRLVFPHLSREKIAPITTLKLAKFLWPLMLSLSIQRISRPVVNLLVARSSSSRCGSAEAIAVLTTTYPIGHLPYGWLNQLRTISPAFQQAIKNRGRLISGRHIGIFSVCCLIFSLSVAFLLFWTPGLSITILTRILNIPKNLAELCVGPLKVFTFFGITVTTRSSISGWLALHKRTKLLVPSGPIRMVVIVSFLLLLPKLGLQGAMIGVVALFMGFAIEAVVIVTVVLSTILWKGYCDKPHLVNFTTCYTMYVSTTWV
ncbi:progressive ankylosis protein homolog B-like isoform X2 [Dysidea avara]|uniref:progressive ankylosis protein homolog B-like isoform X2 n=1 Tax=Dysidea avara TaxID=196820 RepID=UPI00333135D6